MGVPAHCLELCAPGISRKKYVFWKKKISRRTRRESSEHLRYRDPHHLIAMVNLPRFFGKFFSELTLVIAFGGREWAPWLSERRLVWEIFGRNRNQMMRISYFMTGKKKRDHFWLLCVDFNYLDEEKPWNSRSTIEKRVWRRSGSVILFLGWTCFHNFMANKGCLTCFLLTSNCLYLIADVFGHLKCEFS